MQKQTVAVQTVDGTDHRGIGCQLPSDQTGRIDLTERQTQIGLQENGHGVTNGHSREVVRVNITNGQIDVARAGTRGGIQGRVIIVAVGLIQSDDVALRIRGELGVASAGRRIVGVDGTRQDLDTVVVASASQRVGIDSADPHFKVVGATRDRLKAQGSGTIQRIRRVDADRRDLLAESTHEGPFVGVVQPRRGNSFAKIVADGAQGALDIGLQELANIGAIDGVTRSNRGDQGGIRRPVEAAGLNGSIGAGAVVVDGHNDARLGASGSQGQSGGEEGLLEHRGIS